MKKVLAFLGAVVAAAVLVTCGWTDPVEMPVQEKKPVPSYTPFTRTPSTTISTPKLQKRVFESCQQARDAKVPLPLKPGSDGWNSELDRDGDGKACEP